MCKILKVSRSCYYRWLSIKKQEDGKLNNLIKNIFEISNYTYGTRRIKQQLVKDYGLIVSRRRIGKIMKRLGLVCKNKKRFRIKTTNSNHNYSIAPNRLKQNFYTTNPNEIYVGDITYIPTKQGWLYLAVVIDLFSRKVVGWSMDDTLKTELIYNTTFETKAQARMAIFNFIEIWYNRKRLHSYLDYISPNEFEKLFAQ